MPTVEVDSLEFESSSAAKALLDKFAGNPKLRPQLLRMVKELNPNASIPELDAAEPLRAEIEALRAESKKELDEIRTERAAASATKEFEGKIYAERQKLRASGWDDEGIAKIEALMQEEGITSYRAAAALVEKELAAASHQDEGVGDFGRDWNFARPDAGDTDHELLLKNPKAWQNKQVQSFFSEKKAGASRRGF